MDNITSKVLISHWQIAEDGSWEQAQEMPVNPSPKNLQDMLSWVKSANEDIAIEAFFGNKFSENFCFFGLRISSLTKEEQTQFIQDLVEKIIPSDTFETFDSKLRTTLAKFIAETSVFPLLSRSPDFLELGAEGFWSSYGSCIVWEKGNSVPKSIEHIQTDAPQLLKPFKRAIIMEHSWRHPVPMWFAVPVSRKNGNQFIFDPQRYNTLAMAVC